MTVLDGDGHGLAARLWEANSDLARVALGDHFVRGVADGSLPAECFKAYVAQDAFFLEAFARAYALALARSPDRHGLETFHTLITGVLNELRLHASYAARLGVDLTNVEPGLATLAYTDFLLATAGLGSVGETCAAMTPCMRLYAFLGQALAAEGRGGPQSVPRLDRDLRRLGIRGPGGDPRKPARAVCRRSPDRALSLSTRHAARTRVLRCLRPRDSRSR